MIDHLVYGTADLDNTVAELGDRPRPFGVDDLTEPRLLAWVARVSGEVVLT